MPTERKTFNDITRVLTDQVNRSLQTLEQLEEMAKEDKSGVLAKALKEAHTIGARSGSQPANDVEGNDWVNFTPELSAETREAITKASYFPAYTLVMNSPLQAGDTTGWSEEQEILLTREEYILLKECLAAFRGVAAEENKNLRITLSEARKMIIQASGSEIQILAAALESMRADRGCHTPIEQFLHALLLENSRRDGLTPDVIEREVETLHSDLALLKSIVCEYSTRHPWVKDLLLGTS